MPEEPDWVKRVRAAEALPSFRQEGGPFATFDLLGRKNPRRLGVPDYLLLIARIHPERVRRVPSGAIQEEGCDEIGQFAFVECPCGHRPVVRERLEKCDGCARNYVQVEIGAVYVAYGDMTPPPLRAVHYET